MEYTPVFTIAIMIVTGLISMAAFKDENIKDRLMLWPRRMDGGHETYRLLSSGFVHLDWQHLIFNMLALYFMGGIVEQDFSIISTPWVYVLLYLSAIPAASLPSFLKNRHNSYYRSLGASGGVAAVVFSLIYYHPWGEIGFMFLPGIRLYNIIFAILYLVFSAIMSRRGRGNVNHDAHFWGAVYGFLFTLATDPTHGRMFWEVIQETPWG